MPLQKEETKSKLLISKYPTLLKFCNCGDYDTPSSKQDFKKLVDTLKAFSTAGLLEGRDVHPLSVDSNYPKTTALVKKYLPLTLYSVDVCHRGGSNGKYRLVYHIDNENSNIGHVVAVYIDTHK